MSKNEKNKARIFANNAYAVKTVWSISQKRVIHTALYSIAGYVEWIFMSIFFLRYVINAIETEAPFVTILGFIGICFAGITSVALSGVFFIGNDPVSFIFVAVSFAASLLSGKALNKLNFKIRNEKIPMNASLAM